MESVTVIEPIEYMDPVAGAIHWYVTASVDDCTLIEKPVDVAVTVLVTCCAPAQAAAAHAAMSRAAARATCRFKIL
jgi:hypothetical protein